MRSSASSSGGHPSRRPASSAAAPTDAEWDSDPRLAALAAGHERFLLAMQHQQQQHQHAAQRYQPPGPVDEDALNAATFDDLSGWDDADAAASRTAQHALPPALLARYQPSSQAQAQSQSQSRVLLDDDGGDEVSLDVLLAGIAAGKEADLLSRGVPLAELDRREQQQQLAYYQSQYGADEQLDSSMLDSVLKALEEEEDELEEADRFDQRFERGHTPQQQQHMSYPPAASPVSGVLSVDELERTLRSTASDEQKWQQDEDDTSLPLPGAALSAATTAPFPGAASSSSPAPAATTVSVPLPSDVYGSAPSLYIPLPARHFSSMSRSELALVIKLQLSQLQNQSSDSHHNDTFYSSVMEMRIKGRVSKSLQQLPPILSYHRPSHNQHGQQHSTAQTDGAAVQASLATYSTLPARSTGTGGSEAAYFKPTESTLGRLQSSSLKKPKKLMELASSDQLPSDIPDDGSGPPRRKLFGSSRAIAYLIEEGFLALIAFEETDAQLRGLPPPPPPSSASVAAPAVDHAAAALEAERTRLLAARHHCMLALLDQLDVLSLPPLTFPPDTAFLRSHLLHMLYSVGKGRLLLLRCLMRLPAPHPFDIVSILAADLSSTATPSSPSRVDEQFAVLAADVLYAAPIHAANIAYSHFVQPAGREQLVPLVRSKMGCMFLQVLAKKGQDMQAAYDAHHQQQQQQQATTSDGVSPTAVPSAASSSAPSATAAATAATSPSPGRRPVRLSSVSADFAVWLSLTGELLRLLSGQWAVIFSDLPNSAATAGTAATAATCVSPASLASARAMWDFVSLLLSHLTATASHSLPDDEAERASHQLSSLTSELRPLMQRYLTTTYQLDGSQSDAPKQPAVLSTTSDAAASSATTAAAPAKSAAAIVAASAASDSAPRLLPLPHSSLLYACAVLLPVDDSILPAAQAAHRRSEEKVRAFIAAKQARLSQQYDSNNRQQRGSHESYGGASTRLRGPHTRASPQQPLGHNGNQDPRRGLPQPRAQPQQRHQQQHSQADQPSTQQPTVSKSQPGSYAFAAAGKA